jgi:hypothetical protein
MKKEQFLLKSVDKPSITQGRDGMSNWKSIDVNGNNGKRM